MIPRLNVCASRYGCDVLATSPVKTNLSIPYLDALAFLHVPSTRNILLVVDDAQSFLTELYILMMTLKSLPRHHLRVLLMTTTLDQAHEWARFLDVHELATIPTLEMRRPPNVFQHVQCVPKPQYRAQLSQQQYVMSKALLDIRQNQMGNVLVFVDTIDHAQAVKTFLSLFPNLVEHFDMMIVHDTPPASTKGHRIVLVTHQGEQRWLHHTLLRARHVFDCTGDGNAEPFTARRRLLRAGFGNQGMCIQFYHALETPRRPPVDKARAVCKALHLAGPRVLAHIPQDWKKDVLLHTRLMDPSTGTLTGAGRLVACLGFHPDVAHLIQVAQKQGIGSWMSLLVAVLHTDKTPLGTDVLHYIQSASLWNNVTTTRMYYRIRSLQDQESLLGIPRHRRCLELCLLGVFPKHVCFHIQDNWYWWKQPTGNDDPPDGPDHHPDPTGQVLWLPRGRRDAVVLVMDIQDSKFYGPFSKTFIPLTSDLVAPATCTLHIPCQDIAQGLTYKLKECLPEFHRRGLFVNMAEPGVVRVQLLASNAAVGRQQVMDWINRCRQTMASTPHEVTTKEDNVRLVVTAGGQVTDVLLRDDVATIKIDHVPNLTELLATFPDPIHIVPQATYNSAPMGLTFPTAQQCHEATAIFQEADILHWKSMTRTPKPSQLPFSYVLHLKWGMSPSTGYAVIMCPHDQTPSPTLLGTDMEIVHGTPPSHVPLAEALDSAPFHDRDRNGCTLLLKINPAWDERELARRLKMHEERVCILRDNTTPTDMAWPAPLMEAFDHVRFLHAGTFCRVDKALPHRRHVVQLSFPTCSAFRAFLCYHINWMPPGGYCVLKVAMYHVNKNDKVREKVLSPDRQTRWVLDVDWNDMLPCIAALEGIARETQRLNADVIPTELYGATYCDFPEWEWHHEGVYIKHQAHSPLLQLYGSCDRRLAVLGTLMRDSVLHPPKDQDHASSPVVGGPLCPICCDRSASLSVGTCGHTYCRPCLCEYFNTLAQQPHHSVFQCPEGDCRALLPWQLVQDLAHPDWLLEWKTRRLRHLALKDPLLVPTCPGKCGTFLRTRDATKPFDCPQCKQSWCIPCSRATGGREAVLAHRGSCEMRRHRAERLQSNRELHDIGHGIHFCPCCSTPIQKTEGCSHMHCPVPECGVHYCHGCLQQFSDSPNAVAASGRVQEIRDDGVVVVDIDPGTWKTYDRCPLPEHGTLYLQRRKLATPTLTVGDLVEVPTFVYDHINMCARPFDTTDQTAQ